MTDRITLSGCLCNDNGTWTVSTKWKDPVTGKTRHKTKSTKLRVEDNTKRKAQRMMRDILDAWEDEINDGVKYRSDGTTFGDCVAEWLTSKEATIRAGTCRCYWTYAEAHILPKLGSIRMSKLERRHIQGYVDELGKTMSPVTIKKHMVIIRGVIADGLLDGLIPPERAHALSSIKMPGNVARHKGTSLTEEQLKELIKAAHGKGEPYMSAVILGACYGLRRSEICGLRWRDIDFEDGIMHIRNTVTDFAGTLTELEATKSAASRRDIALIGATIPYLQELKKTQIDAGCSIDKVCQCGGHGVHPNYITRKVMAFMRDLGYEGVRLHDLRHTAASILARRLPPKLVQEYMGHEDISTTLNIYTHITFEDKLQTSNVMGNVLGEI